MLRNAAVVGIPDFDYVLTTFACRDLPRFAVLTTFCAGNLLQCDLGGRPQNRANCGRVRHYEQAEITNPHPFRLPRQPGVKEKDALHLSCAIYAKCDYFITTDDRLLKYHAESMGVVTPGEFIRKLEET